MIFFLAGLKFHLKAFKLWKQRGSQGLYACSLSGPKATNPICFRHFNGLYFSLRKSTSSFLSVRSFFFSLMSICFKCCRKKANNQWNVWKFQTNTSAWKEHHKSHSRVTVTWRRLSFLRFWKQLPLRWSVHCVTVWYNMFYK